MPCDSIDRQDLWHRKPSVGRAELGRKQWRCLSLTTRRRPVGVGCGIIWRSPVRIVWQPRTSEFQYSQSSRLLSIPQDTALGIIGHSENDRGEHLFHYLALTIGFCVKNVRKCAIIMWHLVIVYRKNMKTLLQNK